MENGKICPKCHGTECVKNGIVRGKQSYARNVNIILQEILVGNIRMKLGKKLLNFILREMDS